MFEMISFPILLLLFQTPENKLIITSYDKLELAPPNPNAEQREDHRSQMHPFKIKIFRRLLQMFFNGMILKILNLGHCLNLLDLPSSTKTWNAYWSAFV